MDIPLGISTYEIEMMWLIKEGFSLWSMNGREETYTGVWSLGLCHSNWEIQRIYIRYMSKDI